MPEFKFIIGIDLGTTNSAVSYVDLKASDQNEKPKIKIFNIPQPTGPGEFSRLHVLPSFLYIPGKYDISESAVSIPWEPALAPFAGAFARDHGSKVPARLVASAKSWLCHGDVDRKAKILPWGSGDDVIKVSPVEASGAYLNHIKQSWNFIHGDDEDDHFENQMIIITVPASFDEIARDLTIESARLAGLTQVTLIEEPLAAFYSWLITHEDHWRDYVKPDELILVCDVGGGTTDFTLISLKEVDGRPRFERIAVGDHLILGGDNIDLALARQVETASGKVKPALNRDRWKTLCHQCRQAKENILNHVTESIRITVMGEGGSLIAGTVSAELNRKSIEKTILEAFFPIVNKEEEKPRESPRGITELGLPYEQETAITRHLGRFLKRHSTDVEKVLHKAPFPDLILFNGGSLKPGVIQERIRHAIRFWFGYEDEGVPRVLDNPEPDLAVALGASYYGLVKTGKGVRVGSGSPRGYYLGVATQKADSDGGGKAKEAVCLVERGLEEGSHIELADKKFEVLANQPVSFDVYSSSFRSGDRKGDLIEIDESLTELPPIQTIVQFGKKGIKAAIPVTIEADYTEIGTLSLWCRSIVSNHRWQLRFQLRGVESPAEVTDSEVFDADLEEEACRAVGSVFSEKMDTAGLVNLPRMISSIVERPKESWPLSFIRKIADELIKIKSLRKTSPMHESRWLNLVGFAMRPGFGDGFDEQRLKSLWKIYTNGPIFSMNSQVRSEWWILWRRVAGGLKPGQQRQFIQDLTPVVMTGKGSKSKLHPQQFIEIWMAIANMEKLLIQDKIKWGRQLLSILNSKTVSPQLFWSLSRIGARELLYGPSNRVVPPDEIAAWIRAILKKNWENPKPVGMALIRLGRKTGDRARDLDPEIIDEISSWLSRFDMFGTQKKVLEEVVPIEKKEQSELFGESLPTGLLLKF